MSKTSLLALGLLAALALSQPALAQQRLTEQERKILHQLETVQVTMDFREAPLEDVIEYVRMVTDINMVVDPVVNRTLDPTERQVTLKVRDLPVKNALNLLCSLQGLSYTLRSGVLFISLPENARGRTYSRIYDIRDLMFEIRDFPGPDISLTQPSDDGALGVIFGDDPVDDTIRDPETIAEIIRTNVSPDSWDGEGTGIQVVSGHLAVRQSEEVHREVEAMLNLLRAHK